MNRPARIDIECKRPFDRLAYMVATGAGAGFAPLAPGTFGAIEGLIIFLAITALCPSARESLALVLIANAVLFVVGVWAASRACEMCSLEDPGQVVIDEVSGQLIALAPLAVAPSVAGVVVAFALFRLFDIFKPYPIRRLERLRAGLGVMADDALAGLYAAALVSIGIYFRLI